MDLARCALRPQGVEAFASAVGSESGGGGGGLVYLVLTGNDIDGPGALCASPVWLGRSLASRSSCSPTMPCPGQRRGRWRAR